MIPKTYITIPSDRFPAAQGEELEMVNEGMYGKNLSRYLQDNLRQLGYEVPFFGCEDWGWWVEISGNPFPLGLCIYSWEDDQSQARKYTIASSISDETVWVWKQLRRVSTTNSVGKLMDDVEHMLRSDPGISSVIRTDEALW